jgi:hypothetical protein
MNRADAGVRQGAADEGDVLHPDQRDVANEPATALEQALVLAPHARRAHAHALGHFVSSRGSGNDYCAEV